MKILKILGLTFILIGLLSVQVKAEHIPMQAWIHDPVIDSVGVNPSGKKLAALTLADVNKSAEITVWDLKSLKKQPVRFSPPDIKPLFIRWISDDKLLVYGRQKFDYRFSGRFVKWFRDKLYIVDSKGKKFREILPKQEKVGASFVSRLSLKKDKVLVGVTNLERATDYYEVDVNDFSTKRVYRGSPKTSAILDLYGNVVGKTQFKADDPGTRIEYSYKHPETGKWDIHHSLMAKNPRGLSPLAFDIDGKTVFMSDNTDTNFSVLRKYDLVTRKLSEPIFRGKDFNVSGVTQSLLPDTYGEVISYNGMGAKPVEKFVSEKAKQLQVMIDSAIPDGERNIIYSKSDNENVIVVMSTGAKDAGSFYLLLNKKELLPLGRKYPNLDPNKLNDMEYVEYKARDGLTIPAYLTKPKYGKPPYPAVVMPHGGPWARDYYGWDQWAQFLANRGYAVLQPQYRGSEGWGQKLWRSGDREWGQKMQDDKDDGAAWMVEQGIAAQDRIAMYGYSYGGYSAMAAVVRPNSPYQCAIAGAGLSELRTFEKITFDSPFGRDFQTPTIAGLSPLDNVKDANIPLYIFHGDRDQRVPVDQSRKYYKALKKAGKDVEYNEIPDLWHSLPWWPTHHINVLGNIEKYLAERCGPGGL